jgi:plasmid maintenance system killer protein
MLRELVNSEILCKPAILSIGRNESQVDRKGTWSLTVTRNRRLTFRIDVTEQEIYDVDLED